jgi:virulence-associated protein VapD
MKKAQIKMAETIAILTIFFFLLVFGLGLYVRIQKQVFLEEQEKNAALRGLQIAQKAAYMPEFQCSVQNIQDDNCFDIYKVKIFNNKIYGVDGEPGGSGTDADNEGLISRYYDVLGHSKLIVQQIYPPVIPPENENITIYDFLKEDSTFMSTSMIPVSIFDGGNRVYSIGILHITVSSIE